MHLLERTNRERNIVTIIALIKEKLYQQSTMRTTNTTTFFKILFCRIQGIFILTTLVIDAIDKVRRTSGPYKYILCIVAMILHT